MLSYLILFLFATILYFLKSERKVSVGFYIFLAVLICFSGFRDMIGGYDVYIYAQVFEAPVEAISLYRGFDAGFRMYYLFLRFFSSDRYFMFFVTAAIMMSLHLFAIKKHSPIVYFSIFILFCKFFLMSFVYLRQGLAMGILWLSLPYILNRNFLKFSLFAIVAFFFHKSSILFFPIYFLATMRFKNITMIFIAFISMLISVSPLSSIVLGALAETSGDEKASVYVSLSGDINIFYFVEVLLLIYLLLKFQEKFYKTDFGRLIINGLFAYIIINIMSLTNASFVRFGWYYFFFVVLALPYMYNLIAEQKSKGAFKLLVFIYYCFIFFRLLIVYDNGDFMPYKSIFQDFNRNSIWEFMDERKK